jgi:hypothetical protein
VVGRKYDTTSASARERPSSRARVLSRRRRGTALLFILSKQLEELEQGELVQVLRAVLEKETGEQFPVFVNDPM